MPKRLPPNVVAGLPKEPDPRQFARTLFWLGWRISAIARLLKIPRTTIYGWHSRDKWADATPLDRVDSAIEARLMQLTMKECKEGRDFKEIDLLGRQLERTARIRKYRDGGDESDLNPKPARERKKPTRNFFSEEQVDKLKSLFDGALFDYQKMWHEAGLEHRTRNILKSRQIGATWYFAREALLDALLTGRNQLFLSASKAQAFVFRGYIVEFAKEVDVELTGAPIKLANDATLHFLPSNPRTAQSYHGNLYIDEYFWLQSFSTLKKVASGMAMHSKWRKTYFSTPSTLNHEAYPFWSGDEFNRRRKKDEQALFDVSHDALKGGLVGPDRQWRNIVTVEDAIAGGCELFDLDELKLEYGPEEYANLLMCQFVDDTASIFPLKLLMGAMVDSWDVWDDFRPFALRPFGEREVWVGYDPSASGDSAAMVVLAPPAVPGGKFRILEREQFHNMDFEAQANAIRNVCLRYNVTYIGIDATGLGQGVLQLVRVFFPAAEAINYNVETKVGMVLKGLDVFNKGRIEFDAGWIDLMQSFMAIRKTSTDSGRQMTFKADRSAAVSHADLAWATLHALHHEPLAGNTEVGMSFMEIS
ncbi:MAG: terminase family protein [Azoarcus sp.]|jgi:uncharacterized protein YjcR|nr:terminase family protein [Azoarcus sp.]